MQSTTRRFADLLRDGIIGLFCGLVISIIAIVPDTWLSTVTKIEASLGVIAILLVGISIKILYEDMRKYLAAKKEVDEYYGLMPRIIHFTKFDRVIQLKENGDAEVSWLMRLQNLSSEGIPSFAIGYEADIYDNATEKATVEMKSVRIGVYDVQCPELCYEKTGIITGIDLHGERGHFCIPFNEVGGLQGTKKGKKPTEIEVKIDFTIVGVFKNLYNHKGEYYSQKIYHPTSIVTITIVAPSGSSILINSSPHHPNGIEVHDIVSKVVDFKEMANVKPPKANRSGVVTWTIKNPKLTYAYRVNFRCLKKTKKVEGGTESST